jgi:hypothetical protein
LILLLDVLVHLFRNALDSGRSLEVHIKSYTTAAWAREACVALAADAATAKAMPRTAKVARN